MSRYEEKYMYRFSEILYALEIPQSYPYESAMTDFHYGKILEDIDMVLPSKLGTQDEDGWTESPFVNELFYNLMNRYMDEYVFALNMEYHGLSLAYNERAGIRDFFGKLTNIMYYTYDKYANLLGLYENNADGLLNRLQRITSGTIGNTGTQSMSGSTSDLRKDNDTPQGSGDFSDDTHTSFISKGTGSSSTTRTDNLQTSSSTTESWDSEYLMDKLKKIQDSYRNLMLEWVNEFRILFIEGGNVL